MNTIELLIKAPNDDLAAEEESEIDRALHSAYQVDESNATNPSVQRIAQKVEELLEILEVAGEPSARNAAL